MLLAIKGRKRPDLPTKNTKTCGERSRIHHTKNKPHYECAEVEQPNHHPKRSLFEFSRPFVPAGRGGCFVGKLVVALKANATSGSCRTPRRLKSYLLIWLKRRTAEPHRDFIRAVRSARFAHLISVAYVAYSDTDGVRVGPGVRNRVD